MLEHYKMVALVLKIVNQPDYVWVLTHFQDVDLSPRLIDLNNLHVSFTSCF